MYAGEDILCDMVSILNTQYPIKKDQLFRLVFFYIIKFLKSYFPFQHLAEEFQGVTPSLSYKYLA